MNVLDLMRVRYMKGEPLLQPGDDFDLWEAKYAMQTVADEAKARGLTAPIVV